jgi:hypothetical protein
MENNIRSFLTLLFLAVFCVVGLYAQKAKLKPAAPTKAKPVIFAVIYDGTGLEPIALVEDGKLVAEGDPGLVQSFYTTDTKYDLIFGGVANGTVTVSKSNVGTDCGGSSAEVSLSSSKSLKGFVMGLATNVTAKSKASGLRRAPVAGERSEVETLVRAEYAKHKVPAVAYKQLHFHNLTAVDVDNDGIVELIGSYWIAPKANERDLLFFIAEKGATGKYSFKYSDYSAVKPPDLMSGNVKDLDTMGGELLLDLFDYDNDDVSEVFTIDKAFEGNNYYVYKRTDSKWKRVFETYDYRCAY